MWEREQPWDGVPVAGSSRGEEHIGTVADGVLSCRGAGVVGEEGVPVACGA